ncbi:MAG: sigma-70 family RNA polymerase sigma factor [Solirubrobacterales bacterium]|nr:sigma-70 family RNA polymerase sigma factor [Solirubrobacterales bacterium]
MAEATGCTTRVSILRALSSDPGDQAAWSAFVDRYGPQIHAWCLRWKLQEADAQDVTQMVLLKLVRQLPHFAYDPSRSFRGWLRTLTVHSWSDFLGDQIRGVRGSADAAVAEMLNTVQARDDLVRHLEETFDQELLELAMEEVSRRVEPHTWEAFRLTALEGVAAAEVAARLGIRVATVYRARHVVQAMLREALAALEAGEGAPQ